MEEDNANVSIHVLWAKFIHSGMNRNCMQFYKFCGELMKKKGLERIEKITRDQLENEAWFKYRFGRITASIVYEVAKAKKLNGSLQERVFGAQLPLTSDAVKRGKCLEKEVIEIVKQKRSLKINKSGLYLRKDFPIFGASPDGISDEYVIDMKCPSKEATVKNYLHNGIVAKKYFYQLQMQMMFANKNKGLFCVALSNFEKDKNVQIIELIFEEDKIMEIIELAQ
ncbi:hypothetical protein ABEB36_009594 [Hypothenemus hampei]|uniref:YqaJ viral recombinase domain-containing protein n=1 Tax=Hypothenemus hampei TaxID=57062 RepID=A0ABD1EGV5_HYPHA